MIGPRKLLFAMIFTFAASTLCLSSWATTRYIAQSAGTFSGGSACNGQTAITPSTWNSTSESAGDISYVCGTITGTNGSSVLTFSWSGSSGSPLTLIFDTGSSLQAGYFSSSGAINLNAQTYIIVNGQGVGFIEATTNGTSGQSNCPAGSCTTQQNSQGIEGIGSNTTVENLTIEDMYVATSGDSAWNSLNIDCLDTGSSGSSTSGVTISGNTAHDCLTGFGVWVNAGQSNYTLANNTSYDTCWGADLIEAGSGTFSNVYVYGNHDYMHSMWTNGSAACHSNGLHLFQANNCSTCVINHIYFYNNEWDGPGAGDTTAWLQIDNNGGNAGVMNGYIFNNVFSGAPGDCNGTGNAFLGLWNGSGWSVWNNTFIGISTSTTSLLPASCAMMSDNQSGVTLHFLNNVLTGAQSLIGMNTSLMLSDSPNYNLYANGGSAGTGGYNCVLGSGFSAWQSCIGSAGDANSAYYATDPIPACNSNSDCSNVQPQTGSTAIGAAKNLYSLCNGQANPGLGALCFDKAGNARPSSGAWDAGAYEDPPTGSKPSPPSGLTAAVQ